MPRACPTPPALLAALAVVLLPAVGSAVPPERPAAERTRALDASTEASQFGVEWRGAARARFGAELPLAGERLTTPLALTLTPLLELHNAPHPDAAVPNESWRGRFDLEGWWRVSATRRRVHELGLALEHESDHDTARVDSLPWFLSLNDVALLGAHFVDLGRVRFRLATSLRYYVFTCTRITACDEPGDGASTVGGAVAVSAALGGPARHTTPFVAYELAGLAARLDVHDEARLVAHLGVARDGARTGLWQVYGLGFLGNDVGLRRHRSVAQLGVGVRWAPRW